MAATERKVLRWQVPFGFQVVLVCVMRFVPFGFDHPSSLGLDFGHFLIVSALFCLSTIVTIGFAIRERSATGILASLAVCTLLGIALFF